MTIEEAYDILWLNKDIKYTKKDVKNAYESALELELFDINENKIAQYYIFISNLLLL